MDGAEARRILSKLARGSDPGVRIRAIEALQKLDEKAEQTGKWPADNGYGYWRVAREYLTMPNGAPALLYLWDGLGKSLAGLPLLLDVHQAVMRAEPALWERMAKRAPAVSRVSLDRNLSDPTYQLEGRIKIWREIGVEIEIPEGISADSGGMVYQQAAVSHDGTDDGPEMASAQG